MTRTPKARFSQRRSTRPEQDRKLFESLAFAFQQREMIVTVVADDPNFNVLLRLTDAIVRLIDAITITQQTESGHR